MQPTASPTPFEALIKPNLMRLLIQQPVWALVFATFYKSLDMTNRSEVDLHFGFWQYVIANLIASGVALGLGGLLWYGLARHYWLRDPAARLRLEHEGMYAVLPIPVAIAQALAMFIVCAPLSYWIWTRYMDWTDSWTPLVLNTTSFKTSLVFNAFACIVIFSVDVFRVRAHMQRLRAEKADRLHVEAQLQRLQAQMEPHMLFNTLANLHALIETQPATAQDMLAHLIDYLRATLSASRTGALPLREEMARVMDYLSLMQIRMGQRLQVSVDIPPHLADITVPPMLVQPLVENAIKHGLDPLPDGGWLHISATHRQHNGQNQLEIVVRDTGQGLQAAASTPRESHGHGGFGLQCIRSRLETSYGAQARFTIDAGPDQIGTIAVLQLPSQGLQAPALHHPQAAHP
ncbi:MAG: sensor histidine kinase [Aquabacterium sp.]|uniref:sensor histidine kinase n=1 Tax=Aquabacterium sp. TaxID=1872578 RepID=UPI0012077CC6|nr:histidine kinase [Aquabacterium sp.]TAK97345.1 MAG: sensor histidine kinase [Aquabacterium sp.]